MPFSDVKKIYHSITKEAKYMFESNQHRPAFAKYKKVVRPRKKYVWFMLPNRP